MDGLDYQNGYDIIKINLLKILIMRALMMPKDL